VGIVAESVREKSANREKELDKLNTFGLEMRRKSVQATIDRLMGRSDYGTSLGAGAKYAGSKATQEEWDKGKSLGEMETEVRKKMREAAAEERREAKEPRKYAAGGSISAASSRGDGCAKRGKTRGQIR
jgi:hypothetical protein